MLLEANQLVSGVPDNDTLGGARVAGRPQLFLAQPSPNSKKKMSLMPQTIMGTILISLMVVTTNRLIWRRLCRLAETRYKLEG